MKREWKLKQYFGSNLFQYFYYFILVSFSITLILGASLYFYFSSVFKDETIKSNSNTLAQLKNAQSVILSEIDKSLATLVLDPMIVNYMDYYYDPKGGYNRFVAHSKLENVAASNEQIESIEIYYLKDGIVLSSALGSEKIETFYDREFLQKTINENIKGSFVKARKIPDYGTGTGMSILSFVKPVPLNYVGKPSAIVVVNIKSVYLQNTIDAIEVKKGSSVVITDYEGNVISRKKDMNFSAELSDLKLGRTWSSGYSILKLGGRQTLVSYTNLEPYHWRYFYIVPMSTVTANIRFLGIITVLMCIGVITISILGSFLISKRLYSPIQAILSLFNQNSKAAAVSAESQPLKETAMIERSVSSLIDRNKSLETTLKDYEVYQKNKFLQSLLDGSWEYDQRTAKRLSYYGIDLDLTGCFVAFAVSMDNYTEFFNKYSEKQQNMLSIYINENISEKIFQQYRGFITDANTNEIIILINFAPSVSADEVKSISYNLAKNIHSMITENFKYTFSIGVSMPLMGARHLSESYRQASYSLNYRILLGYNNIMLYENMKTNEESSVTYPFAIEKNILSSLRIADREGAFHSFSEFIDYIYAAPSDNFEFVRYYFIQLLSASVKCMYEMDKNFYASEIKLKDIYGSLQREETMHGMAALIRELYDTIMKHQEEQRNKKNKELADAISGYIDNHLQADFSIEKLAEQFYISASHLRKIFKEENGVTVKEYMDSARMKKAIELLKNPNRKIGDIAIQAGFVSLQTFNRIFKLETGKTPSQYRTEYLARQDNGR